MYKIINTADNSVIGSVEKPDYVKKRDAQGWNNHGIIYNDVAYNLEGGVGIGADITVRLENFDAGVRLDQTDAAIDDIIIAMLEG